MIHTDAGAPGFIRDPQVVNAKSAMLVYFAYISLLGLWCVCIIVCACVYLYMNIHIYIHICMYNELVNGEN
jgi:hypothetical protein